MRIALTALTPQGPRDLVVSGDDSLTVGQVAAELRGAGSPREQRDQREQLAEVIPLPGARPGSWAGRLQAQARGTTLWVNARPMDPGQPAAGALHDGAVVATDQQIAPATMLDEPSGTVEIRAVGGPAAGVVRRLGLGAATLGSSRDCHVPVAGPGLPPYAARITVSRGSPEPGITLEPLQAGSPLRLDGEEVTGPRAWPPGALLEVGPHVLSLALPEQPDAHLSPADDGGLAYNRPPRLWPADRRRRVEVPAQPKRGEKVRLQLLAALVPLAFGLVMMKVMHSATYALFMLMSPVMVGGQWLSDRRQGKSSYQRAMREYRTKLSEMEPAIEAARVTDEAERRDAAPDPAQVLLTATGPRRRLWERRALDPDAMHLRIGLYSHGPARVEMAVEKGAGSDAEVPPPPTARHVPASLPMPLLGVIGVAGQLEWSRGLARWLVGQAAALHSPRDLQIVVLSADPDSARNWNWVRWLPHCAPRKGEDCVALVGADPSTAGQRVAELAAEVSQRLEKAAGIGGSSVSEEQVASPDLGPKILVVLDGARLLRRIPGMPQVLAGRRAGVYAICIDESERLLPEECAAVVSWDTAQPGSLIVRGSGLDALSPVLADQVSPAWADRMARAMAPVRDVSQDDADSAIPSSARLLELIGMPDPEPGAIVAGWDRAGASTTVPIGIAADGHFTMDLRADGPHGLVAGTTGAGKSELLQTFIASLAVANRPDSMTFVLIDYKGGSAFKDCARLPHTVGMVSDLDGHLTQRALASLSAELKRREEMLLHAGAKDIEDYWDTRRRQRELEPLPRLVLIIDEFASLVAELPDFVTGLVGIAQRGRSLGVHLILVTQRPAGVVSADIRANTNLRIALRVTDADESNDVIDAPDAAFIAKSTPGRCYVRSGAAAPIAVQSARIGGRRPGVGPVEAAARVVPVPWGALGRPLPPAPTTGPRDDADLATDLSVLVDSIADASVKLGLAAQRSPWLPPLDEVITVDQLPTAQARAGRGDIPPIPYGLTDVPARQAREPLTLDLADGGHIAVAGAARTGRSTVLRTTAGSVAAHASPADVHLYALDCGTGALLPLAALPHCGAVVTRDQTDRVERLLAKLRAETIRRQQLLAAGGFAGVGEQRAHASRDQRLPWMVLLIDWWEGFVAAYENYDYGRLVEGLLQVLREGPAVGLRAVVTTDRAALLGQTGTVFSQRMLLRLTDRTDASLAGITERSLPSHQPPGRVIFESTADPLEAQIAMLDADPSGPAQVAALRRLASQSQDRYGRPPHAQRPLRVDALPIRMTFTQTRELDPGFVPPSPLWAMAGAGGDELGPQGIDVRDEGHGVVVAGPPRSGRSSTLLTMARSLIASGTPVVLITPRRSPLRSEEGADGVLAVLGADATADALDEAIAGHDRYVAVADDAELLINTPISDRLEKLLLTGRDADHGLILAGSTGDLTRAYSGFIPAALKSRCGVFVAVASPSDGDLFGVRLPRNAGPGPLGRGLLVRPAGVMPVQLALCEEDARP